MKRLLALALIGASGALAGGCGTATGHSTAAVAGGPTGAPKPKPKPKPAYPHVTAVAGASGSTPFVPAVTLRGRPIAYVARMGSGIALLSFDQHYVELHLHSGTIDAGATGWRYGPEIAGRELRAAVAGMNGGFRLNTGAGGFFAYGRTAVPLRAGLGSVVTYSDGYTDIGDWRREVPSTGHGTVVSVRQNLTLLIDHGVAASSVGCLSCWGATLGGVSDVARSAIGITARGNLIWAGGENLSVAALADALLGAHVVRAVETDINPEWVAAYLYQHRGPSPKLAPVPIVPGQPGIAGQLLTPDSRDFFSVDLRP
ncbi:MAG TPA: hypothetical protein VG223_03490 [Solirubrobacteraceae bacterium]|nr:hypothetical protein [Solirubrobacteraceae bacterium]